MFEQLEKKIIITIKQIKEKKITPADSGIGKWLNQMKNIDTPCYEELMGRYMGAIGK